MTSCIIAVVAREKFCRRSFLALELTVVAFRTINASRNLFGACGRVEFARGTGILVSMLCAERAIAACNAAGTDAFRCSAITDTTLVALLAYSRLLSVLVGARFAHLRRALVAFAELTLWALLLFNRYVVCTFLAIVAIGAGCGISGRYRLLSFTFGIANDTRGA